MSRLRQCGFSDQLSLVSQICYSTVDDTGELSCNGTPLMVACYYGEKETSLILAKYFVEELGADPKAKNTPQPDAVYPSASDVETF